MIYQQKKKKSVTFNYHNELDDAYYEIKTFPLKEKNKLVVLYNDITHYQKTNNINKRLQQLMKVVSVMGEIIKNEKSIDKLLNRACDTIVNFTDSKLAWITSFNKNTTSQLSFYCSDEYVLNKHKEHVPVFPCIKLISDNKTPKVYYNPVHECSSCNLHKDYKRQSHLIFPMIFHDQIYGVLCVGLDAKDSFEQEENEMFNSLAKDLAYAIFKLETNEELETVQKKLKEYSSKIEMQNMELKQLHSELKLKDKQLLKAENKAEEFEQLKSTFFG